MSHQTLFLQQSYLDCTEQYMQILQKQNLPMWDYIILTASNESQAESYRMQIAYRLRRGMLPSGTHYAVLPDPDGQRVGSGGATLHVLRYIYEREGSFAGRRILVIHSGGDSKRIPQYSACGKLFSPVPRLLPNGRRSTLFDEFMIACGGVAARINGGMLVCSGDVLLLFNPLQIDFYGKGAAALSIKEPVEVGRNHGVFQVDGDGNVGDFLHKKTVDQLKGLGAVDSQGHVDIDTGAVILDNDMIADLYGLVDTPEKCKTFVNGQARLSFYADFLYPLASGATLEQYYRETPEGDYTPELHACRRALWQVLHPYRMKLIRMSPAAFIHFGTTRELLHLMTDGMETYRYLGWQARIQTNREESGIGPGESLDAGQGWRALWNGSRESVRTVSPIHNGNDGSCRYAASNSYISPRANVGSGCYIEDSYVHGGTVIGNDCVISGVTLNGQKVPGGVVLHGLKLKDGRFVARMYAVKDNPKEARLFCKKLDAPLWTAPVYPAKDTMEEAVSAVLAAYDKGFPESDTCVSLYDSFEQADMTAILPWQDKLEDKVKAEFLLEAADRGKDLREILHAMGGEISCRVSDMLLREAERLDSRKLEEFGRKIRIYYLLSCAGGENRSMERSGEQTTGYIQEPDTEFPGIRGRMEKERAEKYMDACFRTISDTILTTAVDNLEGRVYTEMKKQEVVVRLPVRVNWGGGWSDTPPYCMEHGGTVLNAAVLLNGNCPVEAVVRRIDGDRIVLASDDSGAIQEFTQVASLQDSSNPYDPYALHKAALIACGIIPYREVVPMREITGKLGGGLYLSTQVVNVPRGSGLGTSSILAGACVKALYEIFGKKLSEEELYQRVLCMEQIMSTGGGWQDQVGGLTPGIKIITSEPGIRQKITCTHCAVSRETMEELEKRFCLIYSGQRRLARHLLRDVVGRYVGGVREAVDVLYEIQRLAVLMRFELEKGNVDGFAGLLSEHWELSRKLDEGCTNTCIDMIFHAVEDLICGRMICGAGGGGFLQVVLKRGATVEQMRDRLRDVFRDSGVEVWECSFQR